MERLLRKVKRFGCVCLLVLLTIGPSGPKSCPTFMPNAIIMDPPSYNFMMYRIQSATPPYQTDAATIIDVPVWVYGNGEYRYKIGSDSLVCSDASGYTTWRASTLKLQGDISGSPDGLMKICLVGRRQISEGVYTQQALDKATVYKWVKDTSGPGAFSINDIGLTNDNTPVISWGAASGAASYDVKLSSSDPTCNVNVLQTASNVTGTSVVASTIADGSFHVCVKAKDSVGNTTTASNNGLQGVIDTTAPGAFNITAPTGSVNGLQQMAQWTAATGADTYRLMLCTDAACGNMVGEWDGLTATSAQITVPAAGNYFLCAEAMDQAQNTITAPATAFQVSSGGSAVIIENRLENPTATNGRGAVISFIRGGTYAATVSKIHPLERVRLTKIEGIGIPYNPSGPVPISGYGFKAAIHSNEFQATNTSLNGDILPLTSLPAPTVQVFGADSRGYPTYYLTFDLAAIPVNIELNENTDYWVTVLGVSGTDWDWSESSHAGVSDTWTVDDIFIFAWTASGLPTGRAALKLSGISVP